MTKYITLHYHAAIVRYIFACIFVKMSRNELWVYTELHYYATIKPFLRYRINDIYHLFIFSFHVDRLVYIFLVVMRFCP